MVATLQLEVAHRLMAKAGDEDYGVLTLLLKLDYELREWFNNTGKLFFFPAPDVGFGLRGLDSSRPTAFARKSARDFVENW